MTKNLLAILAALSILLMPLHSYAEKGGKGPSDQAVKNASDNASFNRDNKDKDKTKDKDKDKKKDKDKDGKNKDDKDKNKNDKDKKKNKDNEMTSDEHIQNKFGIQ